MTTSVNTSPANSSPNSLACKLASVCSGCDRIHFDREALEQDRRGDLKRLELGDVPTEFVWIQAGGLRDRLEFSLEPGIDGRTRFGLFEKTIEADASFSRQIIDIDVCPQLTPALQNWLTEFRRDLPLVKARRSVRLRVSPQGLRGVWLDFANEDIRDLLNEGEWIQRQIAKGVVVEVGQKRKRVVENPVGPRAHRLDDPTLEPWFETVRLNELTGALTSTPLFATIGTFTQPGFMATRALVSTVLNHLTTGETGFENRRLAEFGAGIGCFTLPLLSTGATVDVFESDKLALAALKKGVEHAGFDRSKLNIHAGDFILSARAAARVFNGPDGTPTAVKYDTVLVDPPRPGLGTFIDAIATHAQHANWVYVSCYPESFAKDVKALKEKGVTLKRMTIVEQFPFTHHFEIVASFST